MGSGGDGYESPESFLCRVSILTLHTLHNIFSTIHRLPKQDLFIPNRYIEGLPAISRLIKTGLSLRYLDISKWVSTNIE